MNSLLEGQCNCGEVVFEIQGSLPAMYKCYCTLCQKQSGTASNAATIVQQNDFQWVSGLDTVTKWKKESGFNSHFCSSCGSPVPNPIGTDLMWIPLGLINEVETIHVVNLFENTKPSWEIGSLADPQLLKEIKSADDLFNVLVKNSQHKNAQK